MGKDQKNLRGRGGLFRWVSNGRTREAAGSISRVRQGKILYRHPLNGRVVWPSKGLFCDLSRARAIRRPKTIQHWLFERFKCRVGLWIRKHPFGIVGYRYTPLRILRHLKEVRFSIDCSTVTTMTPRNQMFHRFRVRSLISSSYKSLTK